MAIILGKKLGMTQVFDEEGNVLPVSVVGIEDNVVIQVKTKDKDGYEAIKIGTGTRKAKNISKAQKGQFKDLGSFALVNEFRISDSKHNVGDKLDLASFNSGDKVRVTGITKGKGFQGVVKRHGFAGMPASHGHRAVQRHGGSIGQRFPQHTLKGMKMPGHMGSVKYTARGLKIVAVDKDHGTLAIKGVIPGNNGGWVKIETQSKV